MKNLISQIRKEDLDGKDIVALNKRELSRLLPTFGMRKKLQRFLAQLKAEQQGISMAEGRNPQAPKPWIISVAERRACFTTGENSMLFPTNDNSKVFLRKRQLGVMKKSGSFRINGTQSKR